MSHDIRTPMNAIVGLTAIAGANIESQDRVIECLSKITKSSRHLLGLINEVLDMARIESGKMTLAQEDFNLPDLVDNLITLTKPVIDEHKHNLDIHINHIEHESVCGDSLRIQQVFVNLMSNAVKYTPDGGNITFSIPSGQRVDQHMEDGRLPCPEAVYLSLIHICKIYVEDIPAFIIVDDKGNDFFADFKH